MKTRSYQLCIGKEITSLDYQGEKHEQLNDSDIKALATALRHPESKFFGPLNVSKNEQLTDLSALYISEVLARQDY